MSVSIPVRPKMLVGDIEFDILSKSHPSSASLSSSSSSSSYSTSTSPCDEQTRTFGTPNTSPCRSRPVTPEFEDAGKHESQNVDTLPVPQIRNVCFIGAGFVGGPTAAVMAYHNPDLIVNVVDLNIARVEAWKSAHLPIHEKGLLKLVRIARDGTLKADVSLPLAQVGVTLPTRSPNLFFTTDVESSIRAADMIFICVNTPTKMHGMGAGAMADLSALEGATTTIAKHAREGAIIVEKSTVPFGTAQMIKEILRHHRPAINFEILSNPEFLAEGSAVQNLLNPDRVLIGSARTPAGLVAASALGSVYGAWVPASRIITVRTASSELAKLAANAMLAQRISSVNAIAALCEEAHAGADTDVEDVSLALGLDARLGPRFLHAGVGFGGSCFDKDVRSLAYLARQAHLDVVADYWTAVLQVNEHARERFSRRVIRALNGCLGAKKVAVFGFAFKDGTNDTRNSVAVHIIAQLAAERPAEIAVFDPGCEPDEVLDEIRRSCGGDETVMRSVKVYNNWRAAAKQACCVCVLTPWSHFGKRGANKPRHGLVRIEPAKFEALCADEITELVVETLEDAAQNERGDSEDPFGRLKPLSPCVDNCSACRREALATNTCDSVDWEDVAADMNEPKLVFDGRNVVNVSELESFGLVVRGVGKGRDTPRW